MLNKRKKEKIFVSIEGNIGVGKSSLVGTLPKISQINKMSEVLLEPVSEWVNIKDSDGTNILGKYYADKNRWSYTFQNLAYITRMNNILKAKKSTIKQIVISDRSMEFDKAIFANCLHDDNFISEFEWKLYNLWHDNYEQFHNKQKKRCIIYLKASPETCLCRIKNRGRQEEKDIDINFLEKIHDLHENIINKYLEDENNCVIVIPFEGDFVNNEQFKNKIINKINMYLDNIINDNTLF